MHSLKTTIAGRLVEGAHVHRNLSTPQLVEAAIARGEASLADNGALVALTGARTGRPPRDKFVVQDALTSDTVDWGKVNQPFDPAKFEALMVRVTAHMRERAENIAFAIGAGEENDGGAQGFPLLQAPALSFSRLREKERLTETRSGNSRRSYWRAISRKLP